MIFSRKRLELLQSWCSYTNDEKLASKADAWLYHNRDYSPKLMEKWNNSHVHVMYTAESPMHETIRFPASELHSFEPIRKTLDTVNWTMTYRRDSEIYWPYGYFKLQVFSQSVSLFPDRGLQYGTSVKAKPNRCLTFALDAETETEQKYM